MARPSKDILGLFQNAPVCTLAPGTNTYCWREMWNQTQGRWSSPDTQTLVLDGKPSPRPCAVARGSGAPRRWRRGPGISWRTPGSLEARTRRRAFIATGIPCPLPHLDFRGARSRCSPPPYAGRPGRGVPSKALPPRDVRGLEGTTRPLPPRTRQRRCSPASPRWRRCVRSCGTWLASSAEDHGLVPHRAAGFTKH